MPSTPHLPDGYQLLSHYTRTVIGCVRNVAIPANWSVSLNSESDVIVKSEERSTWAALRMIAPTSRWAYTKGTVVQTKIGTEWDDLAAAIAAVTAPPPELPSIMEEVIESLSSGEASARAISVITANIEGANFELTVDLFNQIFNECTPGQVIAFYTSLASAGAVLTKLLGAATGVAPESILQSWAVSQQQQGPSSGS